VTDPKDAQGANPWDDEIYTQQGVEYRNHYVMHQKEKGMTNFQRERRFYSRLVEVALALLIVFIFGWILSEVSAAPEDHALCRVVANGSVSLSGRVAEWVGYPQGWQDMPADLWDIPIDILYADENMSSGYMLQFSPSKQELWVFPLWSFDFATDANGNYGGTHDLCQVMVYDLNLENR